MIRLIILLIPLTLFARELNSLKDFLKKELAGSAKMTQEKFKLSETQKKSLASIAPNAQDEEFNFYFSKDASSKILKSCTVVPQKGKEGPLSVGVCFDPSGVVKSVVILSTDEERGKAAEADSFLNQFIGKKANASFQVGKDVDGVSGATLTSKAISEAVRKSSFGFKEFVAEGKKK